MILSMRSVKRPYQQVLLVVWLFILFTWFYLGLRKASQLSPEASYLARFWGEHTRWSQHKQPSLEESDSLHGAQGADTNHPQPSSKPWPIHASEPDFPNVPTIVREPTNDVNQITEEEVQQYVENAWDVSDGLYWKTYCPSENFLPTRYGILRKLAEDHHTSEVKYFFALDLYESRKVIPRLMSTLIQVVKLLGPEKCAISIVEGRSTDGTFAILNALKPKLESIGTRFYLGQSDINPHGKDVDRIAALSDLRNMALIPLLEGSDQTQSEHPTYSNDTIIAFLNDIAVCTDDIYELLFQHIYQKADQTCAMDWVAGGDQFYDSWVSRSMSGDLFFEVPQDVSFAYVKNMFWDHPATKRKYHENQPFQVYSCWGGMVTLNSAPFISGQVKFRIAKNDECYSGEPITLAKDFWRLGYGRIATIPIVNVGYNIYETNRIKLRRGYVYDHVHIMKTEEEWGKTELIEWSVKPPGQVKCMPGWGMVSWTEP